MTRGISIHPRCDNSGSSAAFTLIELLAVIAIMAIMTTYAVVSVTRLMKAREVTTGAHILASTMKYAQQTAIVRGVRTRVTFLPFKNSSGIDISWFTNAVRVFYVDTTLAGELHKDGWLLDPGYFEPKMLGQNVNVRFWGPSGNLNQYMLVTDNGGLTWSGLYGQPGYGAYKTTNGTTVNYPTPVAYINNYNSGPSIWWSTYPFVEFDSLGRATLSATCIVVSVSSTNVGSGASPGYSGTMQGNNIRVIVTRGEKRIQVD